MLRATDARESRLLYISRVSGAAFNSGIARPPALRRARRPRSSRATAGLIVIAAVGGACFASLPWTLSSYADAHLSAARRPPGPDAWMGTDLLGRSLSSRILLGGAVSLGVGCAAAAVSVVIGVSWGMTAGWIGGRTEQIMMRVVDVLYGLPYILLVILIRVGLEELFVRRWGWRSSSANLVVLLAAISAVSWLTMARVIRGQVLSLKGQPFVDAARVIGLPGWRIAATHLLPNLAGAIVVYATLTVPQAILQESFLSFLGIGVERPVPSWGNLAADGVSAINNVESFWWMLAFPCGFLTATLLALNAIGEALREAFDPRSHGALHVCE